MEQELFILPELLPRFLVWFVLLYFSFMCKFFRSLFVHLSFFFWPLRCLSFNLRIRITALVSSNFGQTDGQTKEHNYRTALLLVFFHFYHCKILCNPKMLWVFRNCHCCGFFVDTIFFHNLSYLNFKKNSFT